MPPQLNPAQHAAVYTPSGPLLVLAGAGTGKTRVVTYRIAELIRRGTRPERILAVTFTRKAAAEMQQRVSELLSKRRKEQPVIGTFHSNCVKILRRQIHRLGYPEKFAICDRGHQESIARSVLREIKVTGEMLSPSDLLAIIGSWKTSGVRPDRAASLAQTDREHLAAMAYRRYQRTLKTRGSVDFDDLLLLTEELFATHPEVRREEAACFDHVLIDEYQDTNTSQYSIVRALAAGHRNLCVVGDDDQSIYAWRGAEVKHILRFQRDWPDAKVVRLEENYRSTAAIIAVANRLIAYNKHRHDKILRAARAGGEQPRIEQYPNETEEAKRTVTDLRTRMSQPGLEPRDFAILFRTNEQPRLFEEELRKQKVPYVLIGGPSFYDRREVREVLSYLKVLNEPKDEVALLHIINTPPRGLGQRTVEQLLAVAVEQGQPLWSVLASGSADISKLTPAARASLEQFVRLVRDFHQRATGGKQSLVETARQLLDAIGYESYLQGEYPEGNQAETRWEAVGDVLNALGEYEDRKRKPSLTEFLDDVAVGERPGDNDKENRLSQNAVALMTMHSAKGLEFPYVYMVGMEEGLLPHHRSVKAEGEAIDEERRLCYVGITRAMERLTLSLALTRRKWGKPRPTDPSRFLFEITGAADNPHAKQGPSPKAVRPTGKTARPASQQTKKKRSPTKKPPQSSPRSGRPPQR